MKKLVLLALAALIIVGCIEDNGTYIKDENNFKWKVVVIDTCEYIYGSGKYSSYLAHKGNCRFCQERMRKLMMEVRDSLLWQVE